MSAQCVRQIQRPAPQPTPSPETRGQRHKWAGTAEFVELETLGEPYYVCVICETPFRSRGA